MYYVQVYLRNLKGIFTWQSSTPIGVGDRVLVPFRNTQKVGIVVDVSAEKPEFETHPVLETWDDTFVPEDYINLAKTLAIENFCSLEKVLSLMIPEKFLQKKQPAKRTAFYELTNREPVVRGAKQQAVIDCLLKSTAPVSATSLKKVASAATIKNLLEKEIITASEGLLNSPLVEDVLPTKETFKLTELQAAALNKIKEADKPSLLWGVTGSGKTEIYKHLAQETLAAGKQTLLLLPEIALTSQLIAEFRGIFGAQLAVWHSGLSVGEKIQEWERMRTGEAKILIGARSSILVPVPDLGLIILDEEHEWTYKNEFAPRFMTHDVAVHLAEKYEAKLIFGSATPTLESLHKTKIKEWELVELPEQVFKNTPPDIQIVNMANETKKGNYTPVSEALQESLAQTMAAGRQAVLFLNKRGFAGATMCRHCGQTFECPDCSANMKVHGYHNPTLICHICSHVEGFPMSCPSCQKMDFKFQGWGTQQVEQWFIENFPTKRLLRADRDTITGKHDFESLMHEFYHHKADVLLGTQMVAKGLDFEKVDLVGVILADVGLNLPDFRSEERVFQLLTQVSGRAGRRENTGKIIVQTFRPDEPLFEFLRQQDTAGFLDSQMKQREALKWSPFSDAVKLTIVNESKGTAFAETKNLFDQLTETIKAKGLDVEIFWVPAFMPKAHGKYRFHIILKNIYKYNILNLLFSEKLSKNIKIDTKPISLL